MNASNVKAQTKTLPIFDVPKVRLKTHGINVAKTEPRKKYGTFKMKAA